MNWSKDKSLLLSKVCTVLCAVVLAALCIVSPWSQLFSVQLHYKNLTVNWYTVSLIAFAVPAWLALWNLYRLLDNIGKGLVFVRENVRHLRIISWCCFGGAVVFAASSLYSTSWVVLAVAAIFGGVVLRVVKNVFDAAVTLKEEHDLTI